MDKKDLAKLLKENQDLSIEPEYTAVARREQTEHDFEATAVLSEEDGWTETEKQFAREILQPKLEAGEYLWYMAQVAIYMVGQVYTMDFVAARPSGGLDYFEVKGKYKTLGEDRQSVKLRWLTQFLQQQNPKMHRIYKCDWRSKRGGPVKWHTREIKLERKHHPILEEKDEE